jgi:hypothetical protein
MRDPFDSKLEKVFQPGGKFATAMRKHIAQRRRYPAEAFLAVLETGEEEGKRK